MGCVARVGLVFAYDEGLAAGDDVLAAAVWRNLFHASRAQATAQDVALVVEYIRREVCFVCHVVCLIWFLVGVRMRMRITWYA